MFTTSVIAWVIGVGGVLAAIAVSATVRTYRTLKRHGAPDAGRILGKLWLAPVTSLVGRGAGGPTPGALAWVWSDQRWGPSQQVAATVQDIEDNALCLTLTKPITIYSPTGEALLVTNVRFMPDNPRGGLAGIAAGVLEPIGSAPWQNAPRDRPRARICLLEEH